MRIKFVQAVAWSLVLLLAGAIGRGSAQEKLPPRTWGDTGKISALALMDRTAVQPGESFRLVIELEIESEWHIYGNPVGPGVGNPTSAQVRPVRGFEFGPVHYSKPFRLEQPEIGPDQWVWAYEGYARLYLTGKVMPDTEPGKYEVRFDVRCTACSHEACESEELEVVVRIEVVPAGTKTLPAFAGFFSDFEKSKPAGGDEKTSMPVTSGKSGAGSSPETESPAVLDPSSKEAIAQYSPRVLGEEGSSPSGKVEAKGSESLWKFLLFGFLAGMILNVMPCVLPVISIKVLSLVQQAKESRSRVLLHGASFSAGILVVFLLLASAAVFLGKSWGAHFQEVEFQVAMIVLIFLFSLGLFDVYTVEVPGFVSRKGGDVKEGLLGSLLKGMLATVLATPCSGPFLGGVLAFTLRESPLTVFIVFTSIGLGMAFPYAVLTAHPAFLRFIPKPGPWMVRFKEFMGFALLGTVVYLLTIVEDDLKVWVVGLCLILGLAAWMFGRLTGPERSRGHRVFWRASALVLALGLGYLSHGFLVGGTESTFDMARLQALGREGRTVVVDWTADWCPNCKLVEKLVLENDEVKEAMKAKNVVLMVADITRKKPVEEALLARLGSRSIPFLGIFPGDNPRQPYVLRDIYSKSDVLEILERCP
jgi:thiol:disulfide interchange protein